MRPFLALSRPFSKLRPLAAVACTLTLSTVAGAQGAASGGTGDQPAPAAPPAVAPDVPPAAPVPNVPDMSPDEKAVRVVLDRLVDAAKTEDLATFQLLLSDGFVDVVNRYRVLVKDAPPEVRDHYSWSAFMRTFAKENPRITMVAVNGSQANAEVVREGNIGRLLFLKTAGDVWKLDVQPALAARVAEEEAKRRATVAPDDLGPQPSPGAASQPATGSAAASQPAAKWPAVQGIGDVQVAPMPSPAPGPFDAGQPLHYVWYAPDYVFIAGAAAMSLFDGYALISQGLQGAGVPSLIGPSLNVDDPDLEALFDPRLDGVIGNPYGAEKVSGVDAAIFGVGTVGLLALSDVRHLDFHHTHAFVVGALTAGLGALAAAETGKAVVRRMRPDFRERYTRAACADLINQPEGLDCSITADGFELPANEYNDGLKSFPSGHSAFSFAVATYGALYLGGEFIWGQDAGLVATPLAALGATGLVSVAAFMSASRLSDNRHHPEDVAVGSALGMGIAAATYFLHFDLDGNARWRGFNVSPVAYDEGGGVSVSGRF